MEITRDMEFIEATFGRDTRAMSWRIDWGIASIVDSTIKPGWGGDKHGLKKGDREKGEGKRGKGAKPMCPSNLSSNQILMGSSLLFPLGLLAHDLRPAPSKQGPIKPIWSVCGVLCYIIYASLSLSRVDAQKQT